MLAYLRKSFLPSSKPSVKRSARPLLENLEERLLLYSTYGGTWTYGSRITYGFMPDGTSVGGTPVAEDVPAPGVAQVDGEFEDHRDRHVPPIERFEIG